MADRKVKSGAYTVRNVAPGIRGFYDVTGGYVELERGASASGVQFHESEYDAADGTGYFEITEGDAPADDKPTDPNADLDGATLDALEKIMAAEGVEAPAKGSGKNGNVVKDDLAAAIVAARAAKAAPATDAPAVPPRGDTLDSMSDADLRETVKALTGTEPAADADRDEMLKLARGDAA